MPALGQTDTEECRQLVDWDETLRSQLLDKRALRYLDVPLSNSITEAGFSLR
jgi:hypothetical protein